MALKQNTINFLLENKFELKHYENQNLTFYCKEIIDSNSIKKLIEKYYDINSFEIEAGEYIPTDRTGFVMEIQTNGDIPHWTFTGRLEKYELLSNEDEFIEYVRSINDLLDTDN